MVFPPRCAIDLPGYGGVGCVRHRGSELQHRPGVNSCRGGAYHHLHLWPQRRRITSMTASWQKSGQTDYRNEQFFHPITSSQPFRRSTTVTSLIQSLLINQPHALPSLSDPAFRYDLTAKGLARIAPCRGPGHGAAKSPPFPDRQTRLSGTSILPVRTMSSRSILRAIRTRSRPAGYLSTRRATT